MCCRPARACRGDKDLCRPSNCCPPAVFLIRVCWQGNPFFKPRPLSPSGSTMTLCHLSWEPSQRGDKVDMKELEKGDGLRVIAQKRSKLRSNKAPRPENINQREKKTQTLLGLIVKCTKTEAMGASRSQKMSHTQKKKPARWTHTLALLLAALRVPS